MGRRDNRTELHVTRTRLMHVRNLTMALLCGLAATSVGQTILSPDGNVSLSFRLTEGGVPVYTLHRGGRAVILESRLGLDLVEAPSFREGFVVRETSTRLNDTTWEPVMGQYRSIRDHHRELRVALQQPAHDGRSMDIVFRVFDDGVGFRYEFPEQDHLSYFVIAEEQTEFSLTGDHDAFWIPGDYDSQEYVYSHTRLSDVDASIGWQDNNIIVRTIPAANVVQSPLMMKTEAGLYVNLFEAGVEGYPIMHLSIDPGTFRLRSHLVPDAVGNKAYMQTPARTPWRTVIVSDRAEDILASNIILNLNDPVAYDDVSWIHPVKYLGIWWEIHVGPKRWDYGYSSSVMLGRTDYVSMEPHGLHAATTERTKQYIDFAAAHGFDAVLVEGWNVGWEDWFGRWKEEVFDFVTPYPDFDIAALSDYAAVKGVRLMMHHETASAVTNYERQQDTAFAVMQQYGYDAVKTGYVGKIIPRGEHHDGQWMVSHYVRTVKKAAARRIMVNSHESSRPTGLQRKYPNWVAAEAARGNEFNAWSAGNPPEHETVLAFTRLLGGPMDYTPGIFQITLDYYNVGRDDLQVHTTLAKQLALYVTMYSPLQMAADFLENYERFPDAFQFIKDVALDWDDSRYIDAEPGEYVVVARKAKGRNEWFVGAMSDEQRRSFTFPLDFLSPGTTYIATVYADASDAHWEKNPMAYDITTREVSSDTVLELACAEGGGAAVAIRVKR